LRSAAPVYVPNVDDAVLVKAPVPETGADFVVFREIDVHVGITLVYLTLDAIVEGPVLVLEIVLLEPE
jgi:hypothetical protein